MQISTKYSLGECVKLSSSDMKYLIRNISVYTKGDLFTHTTQIVYEVEEPNSGKKVFAKENQLNES